MATLPEAVLDNTAGQSYLRTTRLFYLDPAEGQAEGWYFKVRGPRLYGPYASREDATAALERMINEYVATNVTGGR
jgi:hypothetical protein